MTERGSVRGVRVVWVGRKLQMQRLKFPGRPHLVVVFIARAYFPHEKENFLRIKSATRTAAGKRKEKATLKKE